VVTIPPIITMSIVATSEELTNLGIPTHFL